MLPNVMSLDSSLKNYLKVRQAAAVLGVHPDTLRRWEKTGKLRSCRHPINRYRLYLQEELERFLRSVQSS